MDASESQGADLSPEEQFVKAVLEDKGAVVTPIPRTSERTPDFDVSLGGAAYIVEVKTREEDEERAEAREETLKRGEVHGDSDALKRKNTISGIIAWGVDQLRSYGPAEAFRVLWIHCGGQFGERYKHQFFNALYGTTRLYDLDDQDYRVDALYFRESDFFRYRDALDGAVITMEVGQECQLFCLANDHSAKYQAFRTSPLLLAFPDGFYDPVAREAAGDALIVRGAVDRRNEDAVNAHLYKLTGRRVYNMDFTHTTATIAVPRE
jgi:hypothetical protein